MIQSRFQISRRGVVAAGVLVFVSLVGSNQPAAAATLQTFFGIDQGSGAPPTAPANSLSARNDFLALLSGAGVESFESYATGSLPATVSFASTSLTAATSAASGSSQFVSGAPDNGAFATSVTKYLDTTGVVDTSFNFSAPVAGVGVYVTDLSDGGTAPDQLQFLLTLEGGGTATVTTSVTTANSNGNVLFFGVVSTDPTKRITKVEISNTFPTEGDVFGLDDLTIGTSLAGTATPEPGTFLLLGGGLAGLVGVLRRRK